ncbi:hypothetical protein GCM10010249_59910 [Streptomyces roseolilacinus]|uniref:Uncharacterized protein n=1 Tax=Streptomyces roseolilacinus TaxID=66904 RepID=A0A918B6G3_9ACTN|nr:hypothetical protein GCM10010249_59910 [Streptomyces roseolilacinus]
MGDRGAAVGAAAGLSQEAPALQGGRGLLAEAAELGVGAVASALPPLEAAAEGYSDGTTGSLLRLVGQALEVGVGERVDDAVGAGGGQVVGRSG